MESRRYFRLRIASNLAAALYEWIRMLLLYPSRKSSSLRSKPKFRLNWRAAGCFSLVIASCSAVVAACQNESASIADYHQRIQVAAETYRIEESSRVAIPEVPDDYRPWWQESLTNRIQSGTQAVSVDLDSLIVETLEHSAQVHVFSDLPFIRQTAIVEASAAFDWQQFMNTRWDDLSDPVGNVLTTGGSPRFRNNQ